MENNYKFNEVEKAKIVKSFGKEFFLKTNDSIHRMISKWEISSISLVDSFSANLVFKCESRIFGKSVIKAGRNLKGLTHESFALQHFSGSKLCKLHDIDHESIMLIEECIEPGNALREESSIDKRLEVFTSLFENLHLEIDETDKLSSYDKWIEEITDYMSHQDEHVEMYDSMLKAKKLFHSLSQVYNKQCLLHGDFHHDNILLDKKGSYRIIDPKGVIGDPIFDIPRFILNEFWFEPKTDELKTSVIYAINQLSEMLEVPVQVLKECTYIETMLGTCWWIEDGPSNEEYKNLMETVLFVDDLMNS